MIQTHRLSVYSGFFSCYTEFRSPGRTPSSPGRRPLCSRIPHSDQKSPRYRGESWHCRKVTVKSHMFYEDLSIKEPKREDEILREVGPGRITGHLPVGSRRSRGATVVGWGTTCRGQQSFERSGRSTLQRLGLLVGVCVGQWGAKLKVRTCKISTFVEILREQLYVYTDTCGFRGAVPSGNSTSQPSFGTLPLISGSPDFCEKCPPRNIGGPGLSGTPYFLFLGISV